MSLPRCQGCPFPIQEGCSYGGDGSHGGLQLRGEEQIRYRNFGERETDGSAQRSLGTSANQSGRPGSRS